MKMRMNVLTVLLAQGVQLAQLIGPLVTFLGGQK
jgi:hypothetical protein